ncbi:MAG: hypothetical protein IJM59_11890 [Proteobacteria bacterium]|nr:hypothetical protein [Pseudomonadota bacterium]
MKSTRYFVFIPICLLCACTLEDASQNDLDKLKEKNRLAADFCARVEECSTYQYLGYSGETNCQDALNSAKSKYEKCETEFENLKRTEIDSECSLFEKVEKNNSQNDYFSNEHDLYIKCVQDNYPEITLCTTTSCFDNHTLNDCQNGIYVKTPCKTGQICSNGQCLDKSTDKECESDKDCTGDNNFCKTGKCIADPSSKCSSDSHWDEATQSCISNCTVSQCITRSSGSFIQSCIDGIPNEQECNQGEICQIAKDGPKCVKLDTQSCTDGQLICGPDGNIQKCEQNAWTVQKECLGGNCFASESTVDCAECETGSENCGDDHFKLICDAGHWTNTNECCDGYVLNEDKCQETQCPKLDHTCLDAAHYGTCDDTGILTEHNCPENTICVQGDCISKVCSQGEVKCDGSNILTCTENTWNTTQCPTDQICRIDDISHEAKCISQNCKLNGKTYHHGDYACDDQDKLFCEQENWKRTPCGEKDVCEIQNNVAECKCVPYCSEYDLYTCKENGTKDKVHCEHGCKDLKCMTCTPGTIRCSDDKNSLQNCSTEGIWEDTACPNGCIIDTPAFCAECKENATQCHGETVTQKCIQGKYKDFPCESGSYCDAGECKPYCGNGKLDANEVCDGQYFSRKCHDIVPNTCAETSFSGSPGCSDTCQIQTGSCKVRNELTKCKITEAEYNSNNQTVKLRAEFYTSGNYEPIIEIYCLPTGISLTQLFADNTYLQILKYHGDLGKTVEESCKTAHTIQLNVDYNLSEYIALFALVNDLNCFIYSYDSSFKDGMFCKDEQLIHFESNTKVEDISFINISAKN